MNVSRRHLPHFYVLGEPLFVTFRLHGSLPGAREFSRESMTSGKAFVCMDRLLDSQLAGPAYLRIPEVAQLVVDSVEQGAKTDYLLHAWVVMPNHVHLLITPHSPVSKLLQKLKGYTARGANKLLGRAGVAFWQDESYDRLVRNTEEFRRIAKYIIENPVKARLARSAEEYRWSSAWRGGLKPAAG